MNDKTQNYGDKTKARQLRREMKDAEIVLWKYLRNRATGHKFRRQHPVGPYVLDFYCYELNLCVELDGSVHNSPMADIHDTIRTEFLNRQGITVLRYSNDAVRKNVGGVLMSIERFAENPVLMEGWHKDEMLGENTGGDLP